MSNFQRQPPDPEGYSPEAVWHRQSKKLSTHNIIRSVKGAKLIPDGSGGYHLVIPKAKSGGSSGGGIQWQKPNCELDPRVAVPWNGFGTLVYVSPNNPICTTGLIDLVSGVLTTCQPGIYLSAKSVPAQTSDTPPKYNVPAIAAVGAVAGTPLTGDLDATTLFWIRIPQTGGCF